MKAVVVGGIEYTNIQPDKNSGDEIYRTLAARPFTPREIGGRSRMPHLCACVCALENYNYYMHAQLARLAQCIMSICESRLCSSVKGFFGQIDNKRISLHNKNDTKKV